MILIIHRKKGKATQQKDKATQHNLPKAVIFQRKKLPRVGLEPMTIRLLGVALICIPLVGVWADGPRWCELPRSLSSPHNEFSGAELTQTVQWIHRPLSGMGMWVCKNVGMGMNLLYNPLHSNAHAFNKVWLITTCTSLINVVWILFYLAKGILP